MLAAASTAMLAGADTAGLPDEPVDGRLAGRLAAIEHAAGASEAASRRTALAILAERGKALAAPVVVEPPAVTVETFQAHLAAVMRQLETARQRTPAERRLMRSSGPRRGGRT
jgi:hypothetical protein